MTTWKERECIECKQVLNTASKSPICLTCKCKLKSKDAVVRELEIISDYGYETVGEPTKNKFGKRVYELIAPCCGGKFSTVFGNLLSGIKKNEQSGYNKLPCGLCGPKHRMETALKGYVANNGRDYDLQKFEDYSIQVRGYSEGIYRRNLSIINPLNLKRGKFDHHLDHIVPIITAFKEGWTVERAGAVENLQMLEWQDNLSKGSK
jgi:5-methylcytosine-specific restriction endonuclease McrA